MRRPLTVSLLIYLLAILIPTLVVSAQPAGPPYHIFLPALDRPSKTPIFGYETPPSALSDPKILGHAADLKAHWIRINFAVSWRAVQPTPTSPYNWAALAELDRILIRTAQLGLEPMVIVDDHPYWATIYPSSCAAIADEFHDEFAAFLAALASRYKGRVTYWEIGNEPDVDPSLVRRDSGFGCWGDITDAYYGGERYGRMLKIVAPAIRSANPNAKIIFGGLLLDKPLTTDPRYGHPERFLAGALRAGAASAFDYVAYHAYPPYYELPDPDFDYDISPGSAWASRGGWTLGKAQFVRDVLSSYGVDKPLMLNETGLLCIPPYSGTCDASDTDYFDAQATHIVRVATRAEAAGMVNMIWYTLNGPGFRSSGLLDADQNPRLVFYAFRTLIALAQPYEQIEPIFYGDQIEAYRYIKHPNSIDVLWSRTGVQRVGIPYRDLIGAYDRQGTPLPVQAEGDLVIIEVSPIPIYLNRRP